MSTDLAVAGEKGGEQHWYDLCAGPHVPSTGAINPAAIGLEAVAGAYWRGDERNKQLQRVYGTAWQTKEQLKAYQDFKAEAERRWGLSGSWLWLLTVAGGRWFSLRWPDCQWCWSPEPLAAGTCQSLPPYVSQTKSGLRKTCDLFAA